MRIFVLSIILLLLLSSCANNSATSEIETLQSQIRNSQPILEIQVDSDGARSVANKLFFRLYKNGFAEFEHRSDKFAENGNEKAEFKQVKISEDDFEKFQLLFDSEPFQKDFQIVAANYEAKCCCTDDSGLNYKVTFESGGKQKTVDIKHVCELNQLTNRDTTKSADIPVTLSELIRLAYVTKLRYVYKK